MRTTMSQTGAGLDNRQPTSESTSPRSLILIAWAITLLAGILPEIILDQAWEVSLPWLYWARIAVFAVLFLLSFFGGASRPLRGFAALWILIYTASEAVSRLDFVLAPIQGLLGGSSFVARMQPEQFGKLAVALLVVLGLLALGYSRKQLFLTPGRLDAPIVPVKWMGFPKPDPWWKFGGQYGFYIALGMGAVAWLVTRPTPAMWELVVPALPAILLFAAMNAFYEEMTFRASMLATLEPFAGMKQAWAMSAVYFGIAHFYGLPYGWIGVVLATLNGWLLGKAMLETRGMFWSWWMHFLQDIVIFTCLVMGALTPGGA
ncbi:MAG: CPBP family intramembrane glutamic endopeptidase [Anaerolineales bacterium]|nr:CPBP family intramembrane glutamic endopeptidase [Anaerolineales bacterium]